MAQGAQEDQEARTILTEDHPAQQLFPPLILFPSNPLETLSQLEYPPCSSMATEPKQTPSSENSKST